MPNKETYHHNRVSECRNLLEVTVIKNHSPRISHVACHCIISITLVYPLFGSISVGSAPLRHGSYVSTRFLYRSGGLVRDEPGADCRAAKTRLRRLLAGARYAPPGKLPDLRAALYVAGAGLPSILFRTQLTVRKCEVPRPLARDRLRIQLLIYLPSLKKDEEAWKTKSGRPLAALTRGNVRTVDKLVRENCEVAYVKLEKEPGGFWVEPDQQRRKSLSATTSLRSRWLHRRRTNRPTGWCRFTTRKYDGDVKETYTMIYLQVANYGRTTAAPKQSDNRSNSRYRQLGETDDRSHESGAFLGAPPPRPAPHATPEQLFF
ncbi:hypothetical protein EVAR_41797_1 [Eumeta japonica]|uniref:Uncharacterized protein n=1 Tax=Eumeta variegata TaxID=151549 RepID=A0A4C1VZB9_EUMVA|nr:hypothetical protein EVAR_41797_1 [Eumeta japonica]